MDKELILFILSILIYLCGLFFGWLTSKHTKSKRLLTVIEIVSFAVGMILILAHPIKYCIGDIARTAYRLFGVFLCGVFVRLFIRHS